ncbi:MAG: glutathione S-transferase N-terminal domain-containing protein [Mollicutes bacterium]|nr:glutathione S-transferase N-terminal domain-containing protein [Mollicutes bacterium]
MIKIYSIDSCPYCLKAKNYLKSKNIPFKEINVSKNMGAKKEMISKSKQSGVPVLDINGTIIIGFDKPAIDRFLTR